jgi:Protein of unknown function (DUF2934)
MPTIGDGSCATRTSIEQTGYDATSVGNLPARRRVVRTKRRRTHTNPQAPASQLTKGPVSVRKSVTGDLSDQIQQTYDLIARRAFEIFDNNGRWFGHELDDWFRAESELLCPLHAELAESDDNLSIRAEVPGFSERYLATRESSGSRKARTDSKPDPLSSRIAQGTLSHHGSAEHTDGDASGRDSRSAAEGRGFSFRADQNRTGELSRYLRNAEDERQQTLTSHSQRPRRSARVRLWTLRSDRRRALSVSISPWQSAQRFESPAPAFETRGTEDRNTLAHLAYAQAHPRYFVAGSRRIPERCTSTTRSQQDVHNARALHGADSRALAGSSRKPFAIGDEW